MLLPFGKQLKRIGLPTSFIWPVCKCPCAEPTQYWCTKVNVLGTLAVFEAIRQTGGQRATAGLCQFGAVFGPPERYGTGPLADDVPLWPSTHYGVFKCCNEGNARIYFQDHGLSSVGLRPGPCMAWAETSA